MQPLGSPEAILDVINSVRLALEDLLQSINLDPTKGRETARSLNIDRNLVWRVSRVIKAQDILASIGDIPTRVQVEKICSACTELGAPGEKINAALRAVESFENVVQECAGNRQYFEAMVSGLEFDDVTQRQESIRKITFLGNLAMWGAQARVNFKTMIYLPGEQPETIDIVRLGGMVDFKRSQQRRWPIHKVHGYSDSGAVIPVNSRPIEADDSLPTTLPLLLPFCSGSTMEIIPNRLKEGIRYDLAEGPFGNQGNQTFVFADRIFHAHTTYRVTEGVIDKYLASMNDLSTPSEMVLHDIFIHKDLMVDAAPEVMLLDRMSTTRGYQPEQDENVRMPLSSRILNVKAGPMSSAVPQYPEYSKLLQFVLEKLELGQDDLRGYRFSMMYPPVPSAVVMRVALPEK